jgi:hypothetical protein
MNTHFSKPWPALRGLSLIVLMAFAACDESAPTGPDVDEAALSAEDMIVLAVLADADAVEAGVSLAEIPLVVTEEDRSVAGARSGLDRARDLFQDARTALASGDTGRALSRAREARNSLADALERSGGPRAMIGVVERAEALAADVTADPESYVGSADLAVALAGLASASRTQLQNGDRMGAVSRAVLAEQLRQERRRDRPDRDRVDLALALGRTAIDLAVRLLPEDPEPEQLRFIRVAERHLRAARSLAEAGYDGRAVQQAELAVWNSLKAVVLPGGVTEEEQRLILDLAETLFAEARATAPEGVKATLLEISRRLLEHGRAQLEAGNVRGISALWSSAVISSWILG